MSHVIVVEFHTRGFLSAVIAFKPSKPSVLAHAALVAAEDGGVMLCEVGVGYAVSCVVVGWGRRGAGAHEACARVGVERLARAGWARRSPQ